MFHWVLYNQKWLELLECQIPSMVPPLAFERLDFIQGCLLNENGCAQEPDGAECAVTLGLLHLHLQRSSLRLRAPN